MLNIDDTVKIDGDNSLYIVKGIVSEIKTKAGQKFGPQAKLVQPVTGAIKWIALNDSRIKIRRIGE